MRHFQKVVFSSSSVENLLAPVSARELRNGHFPEFSKRLQVFWSLFPVALQLVNCEPETPVK